MIAVVLAIGLAGCHPPDKPGTKPSCNQAYIEPPNDWRYCGARLRPGAAAAFFRDLDTALADGGRPVPMRFYGEQVTIGSGDRTLRFRSGDFRPGARALLSNDEWRQIAGRGLADLGDIGWRGCVLADGKAGFEATEDGELVLTGFDKDRPWSAFRADLIRERLARHAKTPGHR